MTDDQSDVIMWPQPPSTGRQDRCSLPNPHFNFFPYRHSFLRMAFPIPADFVCEDIGRDIYYAEDIAESRNEAGRETAKAA